MFGLYWRLVSYHVINIMDATMQDKIHAITKLYQLLFSDNCNNLSMLTVHASSDYSVGVVYTSNCNVIIYFSLFPHAAVHTIAHYYNYERFVAFNPPASVTKFGLPNGSFVPDESTVVVPDNAVSYYE